MSMIHQNKPSRKQRRNRIRLTSPDGKLLVSINKIADDVCLYFNFSLHGRMPLVDAIDALPYVSVTRVLNTDTECSVLYLQPTDDGYAVLSRLADDLRELLFSNPS